MEEELSEKDFEEEIKVQISKDAFKSKEFYCENCDKKMDKIFVNAEIPNTLLTIHLEVFRCEKCKKEYLNGDQANKLDRALAISKAIDKKGIVYERSGNFDGSNIFVRFPAQLIKGKNIKAEIFPVSSTEFFVHFKKQKQKLLE